MNFAPGDGSVLCQPIGFVRRESGQRDDRKEICRLVIDEAWWPCLDGIDEFSHLNLLWWIHGKEEERGEHLAVHPRGRRDLPLVGLFATHAPMRPNPIGLTLVRLVARGEGWIDVTGLDAWDGSPILDVKGYFGPPPDGGSFSVPAWFARL